MKIAFVLHLYQPPTQLEPAFRQIAHDCYLPLIKLIKAKKDHNFTLNIPLSLLENMDNYGYRDWINDVKELVSLERIELTGSAAYHALLTKIPQKYIEEQIVLDEYGLGYYFGNRHGFEGEPSILIKNLNGFFPPELAVNEDLVRTLDSFDYKWMLVDEPAIPAISDEDSCISAYTFDDCRIKIICRDRKLSNIISFKRNDDIKDVETYLSARKDLGQNMVVALDGEAFGHHYPDGIYLLEIILDYIRQLGLATVTVSELEEDLCVLKLDKILESTWGVSMTDTDIISNDIYPFWEDKNNQIHKILWDIQHKVLESIADNISVNKLIGYENIAIWKDSHVNDINDEVSKDEIMLDILVNKSLQSDQFWWSSNKKIIDKVLFSPIMIKNAIDIYLKIAQKCNRPELLSYISKASKDIEKLIV